MEASFSKMVKAGKTTYFMDVKEAKNNSKYLTITATQPSKDDPDKFTKRSILLFDGVVKEFVGALKEAAELTPEFTRRVKNGKINYFLDVKEAKNNARYLTITASQPSKEDPKKYSRHSIMVFDTATSDFVGAVEEAVMHLK